MGNNFNRGLRFVVRLSPCIDEKDYGNWEIGHNKAVYYFHLD